VCVDHALERFAAALPARLAAPHADQHQHPLLRQEPTSLHFGLGHSVKTFVVTQNQVFKKT